MLDSLRDSATGFAAKLLLAFLVLTFAIWGIGDMIRHPASNQTVATIGDKTISLTAYQHALRREQDNLERSLGAQYTPDMIEQLHLPQRVLQQMIAERLIRNDAEDLGLLPSDADVVRKIRSNPAFQDSKGNFDKSIFDAMLKSTGQSEKTYVDNLRQEMASSLVTDTISAAIPVPAAAEQSLYAAQEEQRVATFYTIGAAQAGTIPAPDDATLQAYYNAHVHEFSAPEYRTISYASFKAEDAKAKAVVSDDDLHKAYDARRDEFKRPERRTVDQLLFSREEEAQHAYEEIQSGQAFDSVAKNSDILNKDSISLGTVERGHILEGAEDSVFSLPLGEVTKPIKSPFGWHIFRVSKIEPPATETFDEVRPTLEKDLKAQAEEESVSKLSNSLEDALASGSTLQEAGKQLGLSVATIGPIDSEGKSPDGAAVKLPDFDKFLEVAFKTDEKSQSSLIPAKNGVYYLLSVDTVTPEHARAFDEVKKEVLADWEKEERAKRIASTAKEISDKMAKKDDRDSVIANYHLSGTTPPAFKRTARDAGGMALPEPLVLDIFSHQPGDATAAYPVKDGEYVVAVVKSIAASPAPDAKNKTAMSAIHDAISQSEQDEIYAEYMHYLANKYHVTVNESLLASIEKRNASDE